MGAIAPYVSSVVKSTPIYLITEWKPMSVLAISLSYTLTFMSVKLALFLFNDIIFYFSFQVLTGKLLMFAVATC